MKKHKKRLYDEDVYDDQRGIERYNLNIYNKNKKKWIQRGSLCLYLNKDINMPDYKNKYKIYFDKTTLKSYDHKLFEIARKLHVDFIPIGLGGNPKEIYLKKNFKKLRGENLKINLKDELRYRYCSIYVFNFLNIITKKRFVKAYSLEKITGQIFPGSQGTILKDVKKSEFGF